MLLLLLFLLFNTMVFFNEIKKTRLKRLSVSKGRQIVFLNVNNHTAIPLMVTVAGFRLSAAAPSGVS